MEQTLIRQMDGGIFSITCPIGPQKNHSAHHDVSDSWVLIVTVHNSENTANSAYPQIDYYFAKYLHSNLFQPRLP